jgi:hypothetical protein
MKENGYKRTAISVAVMSALAVGAAILPTSGALAKPASSRAIIGTGADAIIGTGADAIIGTGADAIIGTGMQKARKGQAIIGTGADAIIGTGADAIIGTGMQKARKGQAIIGTGADAIIGTGADAIIGTGADAIIGTGADAIIGTGADAIIGTGLQKNSGVSLALKGPVTNVDLAAGTVSVLGRQLRVPSAALLADISDALAAGTTPEIAVLSRIGSDGKLVDATARRIYEQYVAGVTRVVVTGKLTSVDGAAAKATINGITVDYSTLLSNADVNLSAGQVVTLVGTLPQAGTKLIVTGLIRRGM